MKSALLNVVYGPQEKEYIPTMYLYHRKCADSNKLSYPEFPDII